MVLRNCFLQRRTTCGILLSLVYALVGCPRDEYGLRKFHSQGFLARRRSIQAGYRPVCCSFSDGTCNSLPCSTSSVRLCVVDSCPWYELVIRVCVERVGADEGRE